VASVIVDALRRRVSHDKPINLAFGSRVTLIELIDLIEAQLGSPPDVSHVPPRTGDVRHSQARSDCLRALFPDIDAVELEAGLASTIQWMTRHIELKSG